MNLNGATSIVGTIGIVALATTLVLPQRGTAADITAAGTAGSKLTLAALGIK